MSKSIFNKNAFKIVVKASDPIKYLDGGCRFSVLIKTWEGGEPVNQYIDIIKDCIGHFSVDQGIGLK